MTVLSGLWTTCLVFRTGYGSLSTFLFVDAPVALGKHFQVLLMDTLEPNLTQLQAVELATLSLASVLIDAANLTAEGKVSETDREVITYLKDIINSTSIGRLTPRPSPKTSQEHWNRTTFYK